MAKNVSLERRFFPPIAWKIEDFNLKGYLLSEDFNLLGSQWRFVFNHGDYANIYIKKCDDNPFPPFRSTCFVETQQRVPKFCQVAKVETGRCTRIWFTARALTPEDKKLLSGFVTVTLLYVPIDPCYDDTGRDISTQTPAIMDTTPCLNSLSLDFLNILENCTQPDIELKCKDTTMSAHRTILSARSSVFAAMLRTDMTENQKGCIDIVDISPSILKQLLKYIYCAKLADLSDETAPYLYAAADKYAIEPLKKHCANFMMEHLTKENACSHLVLFDAHSDGDFKEAVVSYIANEENLIMDTSWQTFIKNQPILACEVLQRAFKKKCSIQDHPSKA